MLFIMDFSLGKVKADIESGAAARDRSVMEIRQDLMGNGSTFLMCDSLLL